MRNRRIVVAAILLPLWIAVAQDEALSPLNVNSATVEQLAKLPGMNRQRAETIVRVRERNGPYRKVEELRQLPGITKRQYERLLELLTASDRGSAKPQAAN